MEQEKDDSKTADSAFNISSEMNSGKKDEEIMSKRPWRCDAVELSFTNEDGTIEKRWVQSVIDSNGEMVCYGKTADMNFIVEMSNAFDGISKSLGSLNETIGNFEKKLSKFKIDRKKVFVHN